MIWVGDSLMISLYGLMVLYKMDVGSSIVVLPATEVVTTNEFFDYDAKYNGQVQEVTNPCSLMKQQ